MQVGRQTIVVTTPYELQSLIRDAVRIELAVTRQETKPREILDEKQAAEHVGQKPGTLRQWRILAKGPAYHKKGRRVFYKKSDLDAWMAAGRIFTGETPDAPY